MVLAHDLVECPGPQKFGQRRRLAQALFDGVLKE
jgi:hypothetical protein